MAKKLEKIAIRPKKVGLGFKTKHVVFLMDLYTHRASDRSFSACFNLLMRASLCEAREYLNLIGETLSKKIGEITYHGVVATINGWLYPKNMDKIADAVASITDEKITLVVTSYEIANLQEDLDDLMAKLSEKNVDFVLREFSLWTILYHLYTPAYY